MNWARTLIRGVLVTSLGVSLNSMPAHAYDYNCVLNKMRQFTRGNANNTLSRYEGRRIVLTDREHNIEWFMDRLQVRFDEGSLKVRDKVPNGWSNMNITDYPEAVNESLIRVRWHAQRRAGTMEAPRTSKKWRRHANLEAKIKHEDIKGVVDKPSLYAKKKDIYRMLRSLNKEAFVENRERLRKAALAIRDPKKLAIDPKRFEELKALIESMPESAGLAKNKENLRKAVSTIGDSLTKQKPMNPALLDGLRDLVKMIPEERFIGKRGLQEAVERIRDPRGALVNKSEVVDRLLTLIDAMYDVRMRNPGAKQVWVTGTDGVKRLSDPIGLSPVENIQYERKSYKIFEKDKVTGKDIEMQVTFDKNIEHRTLGDGKPDVSYPDNWMITEFKLPVDYWKMSRRQRLKRVPQLQATLDDIQRFSIAKDVRPGKGKRGVLEDLLFFSQPAPVRAWQFSVSRTKIITMDLLLGFLFFKAYRLIDIDWPSEKENRKKKFAKVMRAAWEIDQFVNSTDAVTPSDYLKALAQKYGHLGQAINSILPAGGLSEIDPNLSGQYLTFAIAKLADYEVAASELTVAKDALIVAQLEGRLNEIESLEIVVENERIEFAYAIGERLLYEAVFGKFLDLPKTDFSLKKALDLLDDPLLLDDPFQLVVGAIGASDAVSKNLARLFTYLGITEFGDFATIQEVNKKPAPTSSARPSRLPASPPIPGAEFSVAPVVPELSGAVLDASADVVWSLADSGNEASLGKTDLINKKTIPIEVVGAENQDWEAMVRDEKGHLWILDVGDNDLQRNGIRFYEVDPANAANASSVPVIRSIDVHYPDGPVNVEAAVYRNGKIYLFEKTDGKGSARVYVVDIKAGSNSKVAHLLLELPKTLPVADAAISSSGKVFLLTDRKIIQCNQCLERGDPDLKVVRKDLPDLNFETLIVRDDDSFWIGAESGEFIRP